MKDWPTLESAVAQKLEDQAEFVRWWDEGIRPAARPKKSVSDRRQFSVEQAETDTGITKQQVSKWKGRLAEPEKYRDMLYGAAVDLYQKAAAVYEYHRAKGSFTTKTDELDYQEALAETFATAGEFLLRMEKNRGAEGSGSNQHEVRSHDATTPTLADLGVKKDQSIRMQCAGLVGREKRQEYYSDQRSAFHREGFRVVAGPSTGRQNGLMSPLWGDSGVTVGPLQRVHARLLRSSICFGPRRFEFFDFQALIARHHTG